MTQYPTFSKLPENNQRCNVRHDIPSGAAGIFCSLIPSSALGLEEFRGLSRSPPSLRFQQGQKQKKSLSLHWITTCLPDFQTFLRPCRDTGNQNFLFFFNHETFFYLSCDNYIGMISSKLDLQLLPAEFFRPIRSYPRGPCTTEALRIT